MQTRDGFRRMVGIPFFTDHANSERAIILLKTELSHGYLLAARPSLGTSGAFCPLLSDAFNFFGG